MTYRYVLYDRWSQAPNVMFILQNPSHDDEPVRRRCGDIAAYRGFGSMTICYLYAEETTTRPPQTPRVGPLNDSVLVMNAITASTIICAWGTAPSNRITDVLALLPRDKLHAFDGSASHIMYAKPLSRIAPYVPD